MSITESAINIFSLIFKSGTNAASKYFEVRTTGTWTSTNGSLGFTYLHSEVNGTQSSYVGRFFNANGADRGGKITIIKSVFKHSRFCKGMIVYRPSFYILTNEDFRTIVNQTNLFMNKTLKNNTDSFIIIKGSSFINMNAYSQVLSIAQTGKDYNSFIY
jgi:hypothetical protein